LIVKRSVAILALICGVIQSVACGDITDCACCRIWKL